MCDPSWQVHVTVSPTFTVMPWGENRVAVLSEMETLYCEAALVGVDAKTKTVASAIVSEARISVLPAFFVRPMCVADICSRVGKPLDNAF